MSGELDMDDPIRIAGADLYQALSRLHGGESMDMEDIMEPLERLIDAKIAKALATPDPTIDIPSDPQWSPTAILDAESK